MMAALRTVTTGVLIILAVLLLSSEGHDVQRGSDITNCSMKCPDENTVLSLYKVCDSNETCLVELWCDTMWSSNYTEPRFYLDTSSGCWTLSDAGKEDSCVYRTVQHNRKRGTRSQTDLSVSVIDPVLITNITSNSSRLGEDIAVSVHFSGEETTDPEYSRLRFPAVLGGIVIFGVLILLIVLVVTCYKKKKLKDVENNNGNDHSEEHGGQNGSSADTDKEKTTTWQRNLINLIGRLCGNLRYEEALQMEMEERRRVTPPEVAQI